MKHLLLTTIAAVLLVGCGESQQSAPTETPPSEPVAEVPAHPSPPSAEVKSTEPVSEPTKPKPPTAKAPTSQIHDAARDGNIEAIKQHLAAGTDVNAMDDWSWTPLRWATFGGHKEIVELLIAKGADVNAKDVFMGMTPLHYALNKEIAELLIAKGADVNAKGKRGTPLHYTATFGSSKVVKLLIDKGADVNAKTDAGRTPLDRAIVMDKTKIADLLRKHGGKTGEELKAQGK